MDRSPEQLVRRFERHQMRGLGVADHHLAVGAEHDQAMRHGVQRPVEAFGQPGRGLALRNGVEKHRADVSGHSRDDEDERHDIEAEDEGWHVALEHQPDRDRQHDGEGLHRDHCLGAVIATDDRHRRAHYDGDRGTFSEHIRDEVDGREAEKPHEESLDGAADQIIAFPGLGRFIAVEIAFALAFADAVIAVKAGAEHDSRQGEVGRML